MLKILLVDDEPIITKGLRKLILWQDLDCEIIGDADNGYDAYQFTLEHHPDIIITDLFMPIMNGAEMIEKIRQAGIRTKIIVLSGYGEFEYARDVFKNGVAEYLLKPVTRENLIQVMEETARQIRADRDADKWLEHVKSQLQESMPLLRQKFLLDLIRGETLQANDIHERAAFLGFDLSGSSYALYAVDLETNTINHSFDLKTDRELILFAVANIAEEIITNQTRCYHTSTGNVLHFVLILDRPDYPNKVIFDMASEIADAVNQTLGFLTRIGISRMHDRLDALPQAWSEATNALKYAYGSEKIIHINNLVPDQTLNHPYPVNLEKSIIDAILFDNNVRAADLVVLLNHSFIASSAGRQDLLLGFCLEFYMQLKRNLTELGEDADSIIPDTLTATDTIRDCETPGELFKWLSDLIHAACTHVHEKRKNREYDVIQEAKRYIQNNLSDDLTLNRVSSKVYMSPAYFSTVFKIKTGENFSDYLTKVRMEAAVHYMNDRSRKTYEIAEALGYKNPRYFSDVFRKYYGMTPSAYRDKIDQNS